MSYWNYRIVKDKNGWLSLREVFYRDNGKIDGYTADPMTLSAENEQEFVYQNYLMQKAFNGYGYVQCRQTCTNLIRSRNLWI